MLTFPPHLATTLTNPNGTMVQWYDTFAEAESEFSSEDCMTEVSIIINSASF